VADPCGIECAEFGCAGIDGWTHQLHDGAA
jgi:hypothetical protein